MKRAWVLFACLAAAPSEAATPTLKARAAVRVPDLDSCLSKKNECWGMVEKVYGKILGARLSEVAGALPDQFFPGQEVMTLVKRGIDPQGHFLDVKCVRRGARRPCPAELDALEERVAMASLLECFPKPRMPYTDSEKWTLTQAGKSAVVKLKIAYPDLQKRIDRLLVNNLGRTAGLGAINTPTEPNLEPDGPGAFGGGKPAAAPPQVEENKPVRLLR